MSVTLSKVFNVHSLGCRMEHRSAVGNVSKSRMFSLGNVDILVPNSEVILPPSEANLEIMVIGNELKD